jgi:ABC-type transporter Mla subunit MlaD
MNESKKNRRGSTEAAIGELLEQIGHLAKALGQVSDNQTHASELIQQNVEALQRLEKGTEAEFSHISESLNQLAKAAKESASDTQAQLRGIADGLQSLSAQIVLLQARAENLELRWLCAQDTGSPRQEGT